MSLLTCKDFLQELSDFLDESVGPEMRAELERHATNCPNCWVVMDTTKRTIQVYKGQEPQALPACVKDRLMLALQKKLSAKS